MKSQRNLEHFHTYPSGNPLKKVARRGCPLSGLLAQLWWLEDWGESEGSLKYIHHGPPSSCFAIGSPNQTSKKGHQVTHIFPGWPLPVVNVRADKSEKSEKSAKPKDEERTQDEVRNGSMPGSEVIEPL